MVIIVDLPYTHPHISFFLEKMLNVNLTFAMVLSAAIGGMVFSSGSITSSYAQNIVKR
jgi:hypothetical protein